MLIEVIACSVEDAIEAERGGAGRVELVRELGRGGLTPSLGLVRDVRSAVAIPIRAMVREADGYEAGVDALERLSALAAGIAALDVNGLVIGFLHAGRIDVVAMDAVLAAGSPARATFHHAFDELQDPVAALGELVRWPRVDRVLTSGGRGGPDRKAAVLERLAAAAPPGLTILAGGGIDADVLRALSSSSPITEAHVGRAARVPPTVDGVVSSEKVAELVRAGRR